MTERAEPAFPTPWAQGSATEGGMSLRDYFAGQALVGLLSDGGTQAIANRLARENGEKGPLFLAKASYEFADVMLEARK